MRKSLPSKRIVATGALVALLAATTAAPALATANPVQIALDKMTAEGVPGAEAVVTDHGHVTVTRSGVGDLSTGRPFPRNGEYRAGSVTKTFVATVVLQLVGEGKVCLDTPIEHYLPGLITGNDNDGSRITVRMLLQHTSGIYNFLADFAGQNPETLRHRGAEPGELVAMAMKHRPLFEPGTQWSYSNTNYIVLGMLVRKITGRTPAAEIARRITGPLKLHGTYLPGRHDEILPQPHAIGYQDIDGKMTDFSDFDPSIAGTAGGLISTPEDLNTFFRALLGGRLLRAPELAEMRHGIPAALGVPGAKYGLGLGTIPLPCGGEVSGHGGSINGFSTLSGITGDGRAVTIVANMYALPSEAAAKAQTEAAFAAACAGKDS